MHCVKPLENILQVMQGKKLTIPGQKSGHVWTLNALGGCLLDPKDALSIEDQNDA